MTQPNLARRREQVAKMFATLERQIAEMCPAGIGGWDPAWEHVAFRDQRLFQLAADYERGDIDKEPLISAAQALRDAWREAVEMYRTATSDRAA